MKLWVLTAVYGMLFLLAATVFATSDMVLVQAGSFHMGDRVGDLSGSARPVHTVHLIYDYWIGVYEVTFEQYDAFCDATDRSKPSDEGWGRGTQPVVNVSWWDAIAYCNWLSEREGLEPAYDEEGNLLDKSGVVTSDITAVEGYRLLTEAEWEYAARGGHKSESDFKYAGSDVIDDVAWYQDNSDTDGTGRKPHPVGEKEPNELGLYDMTGNVLEWCHDWYDYDYYKLGDKTNPIGPSTGFTRVHRGGSFSSNAQSSSPVPERFNSSPGRTYNQRGFRISRTNLMP